MSNELTSAERLALRNLTTLRAAQSTYDSAAEPEPETLGDYTAADLQERIRIAEEYIGKAERRIAAGDLAAGLDYMLSAASELKGE